MVKIEKKIEEEITDIYLDPYVVRKIYESRDFDDTVRQIFTYMSRRSTSLCYAYSYYRSYGESRYYGVTCVFPGKLVVLHVEPLFAIRETANVPQQCVAILRDYISAISGDVERYFFDDYEEYLREVAKSVVRFAEMCKRAYGHDENWPDA